MSTVKLAPTDVEALFGLIYELRDLPVLNGQAADALHAESEARRRSGFPSEMLKASQRSTSSPKRLSRYPGDGKDLGVQVEALRVALRRWVTVGELPPSISATLIQFILITAKAEALEKAFLATFCYHFGDVYSESYVVVVDRALELGVYPLPMSTAAKELLTAEPTDLKSQALFEDFRIEEDSSPSSENSEAEAEEAAPTISEAVDVRDRFSDAEADANLRRTGRRGAEAIDEDPVEGRRRPGLPLAPDSRLSRKAKRHLQPMEPEAAPRRKFWGLLQ